MIVEKHILNGIRISLIFNQITTKTRRHIFVKTWRQKKLSFSIKSNPKLDVIFWSEHDVKKTFIFNQIITKPRRRILVRTRRQKHFHFQSINNLNSTSNIWLKYDVGFWRRSDVAMTLSDVATKTQLKANVFSTSCACWVSVAPGLLWVVEEY